MDQIVQTLEPLRQFSKDSIRLVKRCTKPDRKGKNYTNWSYSVVILNPSFTRILLTGSIIELLFIRIPEDSRCHSDWICNYGIHRIFRQTHPHSYQ